MIKQQRNTKKQSQEHGLEFCFLDMHILEVMLLSCVLACRECEEELVNPTMNER